MPTATIHPLRDDAGRVKRKNISKRLRFEVFKRDSFTCQYCGAKAPEAVLHVDHITPVASGGTNTILNLVTSCDACNSGKSDRSLSDCSAVEKARGQAEALQERREQIKMMADWYAGLDSLNDEQVAIVERRLVSLSSPERILSQSGRAIIRKLLQKHNLTVVVESFTQGFRNCDGSVESLEECFDRSMRTLKFAHLPPSVQKSKYLVGVVRNRFARSWDWYPCFTRLFEYGLSRDIGIYSHLYDLCCAASSISALRDSCIEYMVTIFGATYNEIAEVWNA